MEVINWTQNKTNQGVLGIVQERGGLKQQRKGDILWYHLWLPNKSFFPFYIKLEIVSSPDMFVVTRTPSHILVAKVD